MTLKCGRSYGLKWVRSLSALLFLFGILVLPSQLRAETEFDRNIQNIISLVDGLFVAEPARRQKHSTRIGATEKYHAIIKQASRIYHLDPYLLHAIILHESSYDRFAESRMGAQGLMQLMPGTQKELGVTNPWDPRQNIYAGARYYRQMLNLFNGSYRVALHAYNAGPGQVKTGNIPQESRRYAAGVLATWNRLKFDQ